MCLVSLTRRPAGQWWCMNFVWGLTIHVELEAGCNSGRDWGLWGWLWGDWGSGVTLTWLHPGFASLSAREQCIVPMMGLCQHSVQCPMQWALWHTIAQQVFFGYNVWQSRDIPMVYFIAWNYAYIDIQHDGIIQQKNLVCIGVTPPHMSLKWEADHSYLPCSLVHCGEACFKWNQKSCTYKFYGSAQQAWWMLKPCSDFYSLYSSIWNKLS